MGGGWWSAIANNRKTPSGWKTPDACCDDGQAAVGESVQIFARVSFRKVRVALGLNFGRCVYSWLYIDFVMYTQGSSVTWVAVVVVVIDDDGFRRYIFEWKCSGHGLLLFVLTYYRAGRRMPECLHSTELLEHTLAGV